MILEGAYFQPVQTDQVETMLADDTFIEWFTVDEAASIAAPVGDHGCGITDGNAVV